MAWNGPKSGEFRTVAPWAAARAGDSVVTGFFSTVLRQQNK